MLPTGDEELCWWPAGRVTRAIAAREVSAREYLAALRTRIDRHNARLGLVVTLDERAEACAKAADDAVVRAEPLGPLHGVAMTVKDSLATAGLRTTAGMREFAAYVPRQDADAVAAIRRAGAIVLGKTNLAANSMDLQSYNDLFGVSRNPWHSDYTTGGSSGGGAGAVAAGFSPLELGSDVAGSIRVPAANCGLIGHKPSFGIVPMGGHLPPGQAPPDLAVVGPLGRDVDDVRRLLDVVAAPHPWDRPAWQLSLPPPRPPKRVAAWFDDPYCPVDQEVTAALDHVANLLSGSGILVERAVPAGIRLATSDEIMRRLLASVAVRHHRPDEIEQIADGRRRPAPELGGEFVGQRYRDWLAAHERRHRLRARWHEFFTRYDAILLPVAPNLALRHDHRPFEDRRITVDGVERPYWDQIVWAGLTGVSYLPTTVVPVRLDSRGVPLGVAIAGPYLGDLTTLALASRLTDLLPPLGPPRLEPKIGAVP